MNQSISTIRDIKISFYLDGFHHIDLCSTSFKEVNIECDKHAALDDFCYSQLEIIVDINYIDGLIHSYTCYDVKSLKMLLASYDTFYSIYRLIGKKKGK